MVKGCRGGSLRGNAAGTHSQSVLVAVAAGTSSAMQTNTHKYARTHPPTKGFLKEKKMGKKWRMRINKRKLALRENNKLDTHTAATASGTCANTQIQARIHHLRTHLPLSPAFRAPFKLSPYAHIACTTTTAATATPARRGLQKNERKQRTAMASWLIPWTPHLSAPLFKSLEHNPAGITVSRW